MVRVGQKIKSGLRLGTKIAVGTGLVGGALLGIKTSGEKISEKKQEAESLKVVAGAVQDIGQATVATAAANPLKAKKAVALGKKKAVGVVSAATKDPVGAAAQVKFATAPKSQAKIEGQYPTGGSSARIEEGRAGGTGGDTRPKKRNKKQKAAGAFKTGGKFGKQEGSFKEQKKKNK